MVQWGWWDGERVRVGLSFAPTLFGAPGFRLNVSDNCLISTSSMRRDSVPWSGSPGRAGSYRCFARSVRSAPAGSARDVNVSASGIAGTTEAWRNHMIGENEIKFRRE
jgi:hypothetical protein